MADLDFTKCCKSCGIHKPLPAFSIDRQAKDRLRASCTDCRAIEGRKWYADNKERRMKSIHAWQDRNKERYAQIIANWQIANAAKIDAYSAKSYEKHKDRVAVRSKLWHAENPEKAREKARKFAKANPAKIAFNARLRYARKSQAAPEWANKDAIQAFYLLAAKLSKETGAPHEVDHVIPIRHKLVCGLHVEYNLRVITASANRTKNNKFDQEAGLVNFRGQQIEV